MLRLNETGVRIAQLLAKPRTVIELAEMLAEEYDEQQSVLCNIVNDTIASLGGIVEETQDTEA
jgi:hypothetical protein